MTARRFLRVPIALLAFGLGTAVIASDPQKAKEEELLRLRLAQLQFEQQRLLLAQKQKGQPKVNTKAPLTGVPIGAMPEGAIARLGDSRLRHAAPARCITFSPDSRRIVTGGEDGALRVWDTTTGEAVGALSLNYTPTGVRFTHSGARLAVAVADSRIHFLHPDTLREESSIPIGDGKEFAVSSDGRYIAAIGPAAQQLTVTGAAAQLAVIELGTQLPKLEVPLASTTSNHIAFHPDGKTIALAQRTGSVTFFRLAGGKPVLSFDHGGPVNGLVFSADGKRVATGGSAPTEVIKVWDLDAAKDGKIAKPLAEIEGASRPQAWFGRDRLSVASRDGAGIYDLTKEKWVGFVKGVSGEWVVSPDGTKVAATGNNALRVRVWDVESGKQLHADNDTFPDAALLHPSPDGKIVFVIAADAAYRWSLDKREAEPAGLLPGKVVAAAVGATRLAIATSESVCIYDDFNPAKGLAAKPSRNLSEFAAGARSVAVSPDGKTIAYSGDASRIVIADAESGKTIRVLPTQTIGLALAFTPDSRKLAVLGRDAFLRLWSIEPGKMGTEDSDLWRVRIQRGPRGTVAFSPDGKLVAAASSTLLLVADAVSGERLFDLDRRDFDDGLFQQLAFSPDSRLIVTGSAGMTGAIHVYEIATHGLVRRYATGMGAINKLTVFPDGSRAVSAGAEEVVTVWDLTCRPGRASPVTDDLVAAWANLDSLDAAMGYPAARTLTAVGANGVRIIAAGLAASIDTRQ